MEEYKVSAKIQKAYDDLMAMPEIQKGFDFAKEDHAKVIEIHKQLTLIESPTFHEENRAAAFAQLLKDEGLEDAHVDEYKNAWGIWKGTGEGPAILVEGHLDTVFPFGSVHEVREENGTLYAPGIVDDTRGLTVVLAALRALKATGLKTKGDIVFCGTAREEGMGSLGGMKDMLDHGPKVDATISVDGADTDQFTADATGFRTYEVNFYGIGGHAYGAFGKMANPLHAAARAVAKIADFQVCEDPRTTFCVSNFHAGNDAGVHAIVPSAQIKFNIRSNRQDLLDELRDRCFAAVQEACDEETARWGKDTITWDSKQYCEVPAGSQDHHAPLLEATFLLASLLSKDPSKVGIRQGGSVNGNIAVGKGIPCVTLGTGFDEHRGHSLEEQWPNFMEKYKLPQEVMALLCLASGIDGRFDSILK